MRPGARTTRTLRHVLDAGELGAITEAEVKVEWDHGRTSFFRRNKSANVRLMKLKH